MVLLVLRYGHRKFRDNRASMHVALVARAFGADGIVFSGEKDGQLIARVKKVVKAWGGNFEAAYVEDWKEFVEKFKGNGGCFVHLTMYGKGLVESVKKIRGTGKDCVVMVGSQKVPPECYELADFNVSVTSQPHSEIAALAVFLDHYFEGKGLEGGKGFVHGKKSKCV